MKLVSVTRIEFKRKYTCTQSTHIDSFRNIDYTRTPSFVHRCMNKAQQQSNINRHSIIFLIE